MPLPALKSMAKKAGKSARDAERYWKEAGSCDKLPGDRKYRCKMATVKKRLGVESFNPDLKYYLVKGWEQNDGLINEEWYGAVSDGENRWLVILDGLAAQGASINIKGVVEMKDCTVMEGYFEDAFVFDPVKSTGDRAIFSGFDGHELHVAKDGRVECTGNGQTKVAGFRVKFPETGSLSAEDEDKIVDWQGLEEEVSTGGVADVMAGKPKVAENAGQVREVVPLDPTAQPKVTTEATANFQRRWRSVGDGRDFIHLVRNDKKEIFLWADGGITNVPEQDVPERNLGTLSDRSLQDYMEGKHAPRIEREFDKAVDQEAYDDLEGYREAARQYSGGDVYGDSPRPRPRPTAQPKVATEGVSQVLQKDGADLKVKDLVTILKKQMNPDDDVVDMSITIAGKQDEPKAEKKAKEPVVEPAGEEEKIEPAEPEEKKEKKEDEPEEEKIEKESYNDNYVRGMDKTNRTREADGATPANNEWFHLPSGKTGILESRTTQYLSIKCGGEFIVDQISEFREVGPEPVLEGLMAELRSRDFIVQKVGNRLVVSKGMFRAGEIQILENKVIYEMKGLSPQVFIYVPEKLVTIIDQIFGKRSEE